MQIVNCKLNIAYAIVLINKFNLLEGGMFGSNDDDKKDQDQNDVNNNAATVADPATMPDLTMPTDNTDEPDVTNNDFSANDFSAPTPSEPADDDDQSAPSVTSTIDPTEFDGDTDKDTEDDKGDADDLLGLKQEALKELSPLVDQLDQTPEEKFRTTMMMIQATDDKTLLTDAYKTAQTITDEKAKAQALLDVVNEINYFSQK